MNTCPACQRDVPEERKECPYCGVVFAKWRLRVSSLSTVAATSYNYRVAPIVKRLGFVLIIAIAALALERSLSTPKARLNTLDESYETGQGVIDKQKLSKVKDVSIRRMISDLVELSENLSTLETRVRSLKTAIDASPSRSQDQDAHTNQSHDIKAVGAEAFDEWERFKSLSGRIDNLGDPRESPAAELRQLANHTAIRIAKLRNSLISLHQYLTALSDSPTADKGNVLSTKHLLRKTLLDLPQPVPPQHALKPLSSRLFNLWHIVFSLTHVIGDPLGRSRLVHRQNGLTCDIVVQQEILMEYGLLTPGDPSRLEDELYQEAVRKGFWVESDSDRRRRYLNGGGTPEEYSGNLLPEYGLIITKYFDASPSQLFSTVSSGKMVSAVVRGEELWGRPNLVGNHTIVITGVEVSILRQVPLGYYINDSATNQGGQYIPMDKFLHAWYGKYVEVQ